MEILKPKPTQTQIFFASPKYEVLLKPHRYKIFYGGRGGGKSWAAALAILLLAQEKPILVLCCRLVQVSIEKSVHQLFKVLIEQFNWGDRFIVTKTEITCKKTKSKFVFSGLSDINNIKSYESVDICWVEEAQDVPEETWDVLTPTIRKPKSEIWVTFNPNRKSDATYRLFVLNPPQNSVVVKINYYENAFVTQENLNDAQKARDTDFEKYRWVWLGEPRGDFEGSIFSKQVQEAQDTGRIGSFPHSPSVPVNVSFDLGYSDATSMWFSQVRDIDQINMIHYFEKNREHIEFYLHYIFEKKREYNVRNIILPHDARQNNTGMVKTIERQIKDYCDRFYFKVNIFVMPRLEVEVGISTVREIFPRIFFNLEETRKGIDMLSEYHYDFNEKDKVFSKKPKHDASSNCADSFRQHCLWLNSVNLSQYTRHKRYISAQKTQSLNTPNIHWATL